MGGFDRTEGSVRSKAKAKTVRGLLSMVVTTVLGWEDVRCNGCTVIVRTFQRARDKAFWVETWRKDSERKVVDQHVNIKDVGVASKLYKAMKKVMS